MPHTHALAGLTDDKELWQAFLHYCHSLKSVAQVRPAALLCASCFCIVFVHSRHASSMRHSLLCCTCAACKHSLHNEVSVNPKLSLFQSSLPLVVLPFACRCRMTHACSHEPHIGVHLQGQYACVMIAHEDVEDDAHWISWLRHSAQVCLAAGKHWLSFSALGLVAWLAGPG